MTLTWYLSHRKKRFMLKGTQDALIDALLALSSDPEVHYNRTLLKLARDGSSTCTITVDLETMTTTENTFLKRYQMGRRIKICPE